MSFDTVLTYYISVKRTHETFRPRLGLYEKTTIHKMHLFEYVCALVELGERFLLKKKKARALTFPLFKQYINFFANYKLKKNNLRLTYNYNLSRFLKRLISYHYIIEQVYISVILSFSLNHVMSFFD